MNWINKILMSVAKVAKQKKKQRQLLWLIGLVFLLAFAFGWYNEVTNYYLLIPVAATIGLSIIFPKLIQPFLYVWMLFGMLMSELFSPVILGLIFILGIIPTAIFVNKKTKKGWVKSDEKHSFDEQF